MILVFWGKLLRLVMATPGAKIHDVVRETYPDSALAAAAMRTRVQGPNAESSDIALSGRLFVRRVCVTSEYTQSVAWVGPNTALSVSVRALSRIKRQA
ncbi:hypothetical protein BOTBODRAFT_616238 [Botryobasidium botryosum FD-172 SS1]|uniref:Uncharacterized protein n=1 Tax=Botryobasidium botryosum (strain FD-172 SS1) TaxID=930990 RepID=A0A067M6H9_BOTB1|nr:hypothetical protein BOTBODRAFT_616238 [Botryobasidium botryosum FD-172 SS1]